MPLPARAAAIVTVLNLRDMSLTRRWDRVLPAAGWGGHAARVNLRFSTEEVQHDVRGIAWGGRRVTIEKGRGDLRVGGFTCIEATKPRTHFVGGLGGLGRIWRGIVRAHFVTDRGGAGRSYPMGPAIIPRAWGAQVIAGDPRGRRGMVREPREAKSAHCTDRWIDGSSMFGVGM